MTPETPTPEAELLEDLLDEIVDAFDLDAEVDVRFEDGVLVGEIDGDDLGHLIGRHGHTIDAIQHLAQRICTRDSEERVRIVVDAAGYRERRRELLESRADEAAEQALDTGRAVSLDSMSAAERRIVHEHLRDRGDVVTHSEGMEPDRHLVVEPAEA